MGLPWKQLLTGAPGAPKGRTGNFGLNSNSAPGAGNGPIKSAAINSQPRFGGGMKKMDAQNDLENKLGNKLESKNKPADGAAKPGVGALQHNKSITVRKFAEQTMNEMEKSGAFNKYLPAGAKKKDKLNLVLGMAAKIEGKKKVDLNSWVHRDKAVDFGNKLRLGKESFGNKKSCYSDLQARKAVGGVIGGITGSKPIDKWAKR